MKEEHFDLLVDILRTLNRRGEIDGALDILHGMNERLTIEQKANLLKELVKSKKNTESDTALEAAKQKAEQKDWIRFRYD